MQFSCTVRAVRRQLYLLCVLYAALPDPVKQPLDGESLLPLLAGKTDHLQREAIFWHMPGYLPSRQAPATAMRAGAWKLIENYEDGSIEMYNLEQDIGETTNLAARMPERTAQLHARLRAWVSSTDGRIPPRNPDYQPK